MKKNEPRGEKPQVSRLGLFQNHRVGNDPLELCFYKRLHVAVFGVDAAVPVGEGGVEVGDAQRLACEVDGGSCWDSRLSVLHGQLRVRASFPGYV